MLAASYLATFLNYEKNLATFHPRAKYLQRVRAVLAQLGSPQQHLKIIHIAGSKGKGSTAIFVANILREAGHRVGLFTSPHLYDVRERIRILEPAQKLSLATSVLFSGSISQHAFSKLIQRISPQLEAGRNHSRYGRLTYFEVLTMAALCYFKDQAVDWVVLETGLGGRLDATNAGIATVSVIAPISLEHTRQLGNTIAKIAAEKAAIIKSAQSCVVVAPQKPEALKVIVARCRDVGVAPVLIGRDLKIKSLFWDAARAKQEFKIGHDVFTSSLLGEHQMINAAVAVGVARALHIPANIIKKGIAKTTWPLRFEIISRKPLVICDAAHNPESCERLSETLEKIFPKRKWILIFGCSDDKDIAGLLRPLLRKTQDVIVTSAKHPRALTWTAENVEHYFPRGNVIVSPSVKTALRFAEKMTSSQHLIIVAGSIFVAAQARAIFLKKL